MAMELEAKVLDSEKEVVDGYFYATTDVEYVLNDAQERAFIEHDYNWDTIEVYYFNEDECLGFIDKSGYSEIYTDED